MSSLVTMVGSMTPLPMVLATCRPKKSTAITLKNAAHATAKRGESTRVETMVATELAASFIPLRKSNSSARAMISGTVNSTGPPQEFLSTMPSRRLPTSSQRSVAFST